MPAAHESRRHGPHPAALAFKVRSSRVAAASRPCTAADSPRPRRSTPIVQHHLESFLARAADVDPQGTGIPHWVERDFRAYLRCGMLAHGFARIGAAGGAGCRVARSSPLRLSPFNTSARVGSQHRSPLPHDVGRGKTHRADAPIRRFWRGGGVRSGPIRPGARWSSRGPQDPGASRARSDATHVAAARAGCPPTSRPTSGGVHSISSEPNSCWIWRR